MSDIYYSGGVRRDPRAEWVFSPVVTAESEMKDIAPVIAVDQLVEEVTDV